MNKFCATVVDVKVDNGLAIITLEANQVRIKTVIIGNSGKESAYKMGEEVTAIIKETEVVIAKNLNLQISLQNRIPGTIKSIEKNSLLSKINLDTAIGSLTSVITSHATEELKLSVDDEVLALIKTNEIMLLSQ